jgi:alanine-glyoxylate transaminase/serine-glyoxylate transaminase/serine-pyruvate transaminase
MRAAWQSMGLALLCKPELAANTLSALRFPEGVDGSLVQAIKKRGVVVAGGLHPSCRGSYFRVGHMGEVVHRPDALLQTVEAVGHALGDVGSPVDVTAARAAAAAVLGV